MNNAVIFTFGRFNPPHIGHERLIHRILSESKKRQCDHYVVLSETIDNSKNILSVKEKERLLKLAIPDANILPASMAGNTLFEWLDFLANKCQYKELILIYGEDRTLEILELVNKYNGTEYLFENIQGISVPRDSFVSSTDMRRHARKGEFSLFEDIALYNLPKDETYKLYSYLNGMLN